MPTLGTHGQPAWPVADVPQLKAAIRRLTQLSRGDNLPTTVAVRAHVIRRAIDLRAAYLLPNNWMMSSRVREALALDLGWLREDAWDLGRAALLLEVAQRMRTYMDLGCSSGAVTVVAGADGRVVLPEDDYRYDLTVLDEVEVMP